MRIFSIKENDKFEKFSQTHFHVVHEEFEIFKKFNNGSQIAFLPPAVEKLKVVGIVRDGINNTLALFVADSNRNFRKTMLFYIKYLFYPCRV